MAGDSERIKIPKIRFPLEFNAENEEKIRQVLKHLKFKFPENNEDGQILNYKGVNFLFKKKNEVISLETPIRLDESFEKHLVNRIFRNYYLRFPIKLKKISDKSIKEIIQSLSKTGFKNKNSLFPIRFKKQNGLIEKLAEYFKLIKKLPLEGAIFKYADGFLKLQENNLYHADNQDNLENNIKNEMEIISKLNTKLEFDYEKPEKKYDLEYLDKYNFEMEENKNKTITLSYSKNSERIGIKDEVKLIKKIINTLPKKLRKKVYEELNKKIYEDLFYLVAKKSNLAKSLEITFMVMKILPLMSPVADLAREWLEKYFAKKAESEKRRKRK